MHRFILVITLLWVSALSAEILTSFSVTEPAGIAHRSLLIEQGVPVRPMSVADAAKLTVTDTQGQQVRSVVEVESKDPLGRVRWLRVSMAVPMQASERRIFNLQSGTPVPVTPLAIKNDSGTISIQGPNYLAEFSGKDRIRLTAGKTVVLEGPLSGQVYPDARSLINAGGKTTVLAQFEPAGWTMQSSGSEAIVTLRGRSPKQKPYNYIAGNNEAISGFDIDVRFSFQPLNSSIAFDWRLTNRTGYKCWLERFALVLPVSLGTTLTASERNSSERLGNWADFAVNGQQLGIAAPFVDDIGEGSGMRLEPGGLLYGGIDMPPDGGFGGAVPAIHRLFYNGMARTFQGTLTLDAPAKSAAFHPLMVLPPQYYSDTGVLPEDGDRVNAGEFQTAVVRSAEALLAAQWRGTLWYGEWWREWDLGRRQGTEEASNGNSLTAPLYHFMRTGDRRFFDAASRSAWYAYDIQEDHKKTGFGAMFHTRRHMLDELDWIHPRYQRAFGPILISHILLCKRERDEAVATVRHFSEQIQGPDGVPHDWDERANKRAGETGVDTTNFIEALIACWEVTGDQFFLDRARGYTRWALKKWETSTDRKFWNWNLTRYVETGLLAICRAAREYPGTVPEQTDFLKDLIGISSHTVGHPELANVAGTIGGGELHYVFYHAWLDVEVSQMANNPALIAPLAKIVREQLARQNANGVFPMDTGTLWSQYPTQVISYYDPKAVVAYLPVLGARLAATH